MEFNLLLADQIGAHLKSLRKLRGLSQAQLGLRLGVGQARVAAIEANPGAVSVEQLLRVFQVLGVDLVARVKPGSGTALGKPTSVAIAPKPPAPLVIKKNRGQW
jgi:HTH-type transcriptional regulator/antitoxin HipB